jgi:hypothetical protein
MMKCCRCRRQTTHVGAISADTYNKTTYSEHKRTNPSAHFKYTVGNNFSTALEGVDYFLWVACIFFGG